MDWFSDSGLSSGSSSDDEPIIPGFSEGFHPPNDVSSDDDGQFDGRWST